MKSTRLWTALAFVFVAAALRLIPHPSNVTPIAGMALFGGAHLGNYRLALLAPFAALLLSDWALGFHALMPAVYGAFALIVALGAFLRGRDSWLNVLGASVAGSLLFFAITNFAAWLNEGYPRTLAGLGKCFVMALPFLRNSVVGDLAFAGAFFGAWKILTANGGLLSRSDARAEAGHAR